MAAEGLTPDDVNMFKAAMGEAVMVRLFYHYTPHVTATYERREFWKRRVGSERFA
jgi:hypothetical protein